MQPKELKIVINRIILQKNTTLFFFILSLLTITTHLLNDFNLTDMIKGVDWIVHNIGRQK